MSDSLQPHELQHAWPPCPSPTSGDIYIGINLEYSLERLMLKLQYFGHLIQRANSLEKTLMLGKTEGEKGTTENEMVGWHH